MYKRTLYRYTDIDIHTYMWILFQERVKRTSQNICCDKWTVTLTRLRITDPGITILNLMKNLSDFYVI